MVKIEDVKYWNISGGISHAVASIKSGWIHEACGTLIVCNATVEDLDTKPTKRICKECRKALENATKY